jgi:NAD+ synthase (glutamine-hydrolysing)
MPCFGTTERTRDNARRLCAMLGVDFREIDITKSVRRHLSDIGHGANKTDVVFENAQARERTQVLMDIANMERGLVVGTGDLSEMALGWSTYNGDHMSMYAVNCGVPKTLVRHLVGFAAGQSGPELKEVLDDILDTPISPELLPPDGSQTAQKTEDIIGPYELHDFFLYYIVRWGYEPQKVRRVAARAFAGEYTEAEITRWLRVFIKRFFAQQFKRSCVPNGPKIGSVGLSPRGDWRMPSDAWANAWLEQLD